MAASYLEASLDRLGASVGRADVIEICINPDVALPLKAR